MSNFKCTECGMINIDCSKDEFKTPREIELEQKLKIAEEFIEFLASGKCSPDVCELQSREDKNCLACFEDKAEEALQKMKEVK